MKHNGLMWSVVCGTRRNGKQKNPSVSMAFKYVVTHIADKTYKEHSTFSGRWCRGISLYDDGSNPSYAPTIFYFMFNNYLYSNRPSAKISGLWVFGATGSMAVSKTADRGSNPLSPALYLIYISPVKVVISYFYFFET